MEEATKTYLEAQGEEEDRISELADDLIFEVLRRLDMKSAAQTSLLSKRWRYVWTNWTDLDFDPWKIVPEYNSWEAFNSELTRARYSDWVSRVVNNHHGPSVDRFRIFFPFDARYSSQIDAWLKFAISKKVKKLELDFLKLRDPMDHDYRLRDLGGFSFLTSLRLSKISVTKEFLEEFILVQCPLLEQIYVSYSVDLVGFELKDSSCKCKLKRLGIRDCPNLEMVKIHSDSLEYFELCDEFRRDAQHTLMQTLIELDCTPSLVEASFGGQCCYKPDLIRKTIALVSKKQVSALTVSLTASDLSLYYAYHLNIPSLNNVKRLTLMIIDDFAWVDLLPCFIKACPVLCELKIQVYWGVFMDEEAQIADELLEMDGKDLKAYQGKLIEDKDTYPSLRVFELVGFLGIHLDVRLMWFIAVRAFNLKTIICDPHCYIRECCADEYNELASMKETFRQRASKLAPALASLQSGLNVIIK